MKDDGPMRPLLIDLFCKEGGASVGYHRAGFRVIGVDVEPQPRYPFQFIQADAFEFPIMRYRPAAITASPPCTDHSALQSPDHGTGWMLPAMLDRLWDLGLPFIVENVEGAREHMPNATLLCGTEFGLKVGNRWLKRHRLFESNRTLTRAGECRCSGVLIGGVYGHGGGKEGGRGHRKGFMLSVADRRKIMECPWMSVAGTANAIPPRYTEHLGRQLIRQL